jgi:fermentation-respiration switch protein FrsA (DUF1100 family)
MAKFLYPLLPLGAFLPNRFTNDSRIQNVAIPHLIIHGDRDGVVPVRMAHELLSLASAPKTLFTVPGAQHTDSLVRGGPQLESSIIAFIREHLDHAQLSTSS